MMAEHFDEEKMREEDNEAIRAEGRAEGKADDILSTLVSLVKIGMLSIMYMPPPEPHLHGVQTAPCRTLNRALPEQNRTRSRSLSEYTRRLPSGKSALSLIRAQDNLYGFSQEWL